MLPSPSPRPSPAGRGSHRACAPESATRSESRNDWERFPLSPRERVGVRGKGAVQYICETLMCRGELLECRHFHGPPGFGGAIGGKNDFMTARGISEAGVGHLFAFVERV